MTDRVDTGFIFGTDGNLAGALGDGWSVEDHYAWAIGQQSQMSLPLPGDDEAYVLRLLMHPLVHAGLRASQRLTIVAGDLQLGHFDLTRRDTIEIALPLALTQQRSRLDLTLIHPDAIRPLDFKDSPDARWLTLCFHSGGLARSNRDTNGDAADIVHAVIAGHGMAQQIARIVSNLPSLREHIQFHYVSPDDSTDAAVGQLPAGTLGDTKIYWKQSGVGTPEVVAALRDAIPDDCDVQRIPSPHMTALWPLQGVDSRRIAEPGRYATGRYQFSDRVGASMANMMLPDDVVLLAYESMAEKETADLDAWLESDLAGWRQLDATNDVQVADFIYANFRRQRLFSAPTFATAALLRHVIDQLVRTPSISAVAEPAKLARELDALMIGYVTHWQELPIHPHIARHFGLQWWQPEHALSLVRQFMDVRGIRAELYPVEPVAPMSRSILIYANCQGEELSITGRYMPGLTGRIGFKWIPLHKVTDEDWDTRYAADFMSDVVAVWEQVEGGDMTQHRQELHARLPSGVQIGALSTAQRIVPVAVRRQRPAHRSRSATLSWPDSVAAMLAPLRPVGRRRLQRNICE